MQNNNLTRFDEGGTHETSPLNGIPQGVASDGSQNLVEEGESKMNNFIYSNRITLDSNRIKQFNLPGYAANKSVASASKAIEDKFKDRNDKYANETKKTLLDRLANAQESVKAEQDQTRQSMQTNSQQAPEDMMGGQIPEGMEEFVQSQDSQQMAAYGGYQKKYFNGGYIQGDANLDGTVNPLDKPVDGESAAPSAGSIIGGVSTALELGQTAFGKASQDISGTQASDRVGGVGMVGGAALKGAAAGTAIMPGIGTAIGAGVGLLAGGLGLGKARKAEALNTQRFAMNTNRGLSDNYAAYGGNLNISKYADGGLIDPPLKKPIVPITSITQPQLASNVQSLTGINNAPVNQNMNFNTKQIVRYQPGVSNDKMGQGFYLYSKNAGEPGFDVNRHREFVKQSEMGAVQRTPEWVNYMKDQSATKQFAEGGELPTFTTPQLQQTIGLQPGVWGPKSIAALKTWQKSNGLVADGIAGSATYKQAGLMDGNGKYQFKRPDIADTSNEVVTAPINTIPSDTPTQTLAGFEKYAEGKLPTTTNQKLNNALKYVGENAGESLRYAPIAANLLQMKNLKKPTGVQYQTLGNRFKPSYVDEAQGRNIVDAEGNNTIAAISQSGASQGATRNAILGAGLNKTRALSDVYANASAQNRAQDVQAQQFNANIDQSNVATANRAIDEMRMDDAAYRGAKSKIIANTGTAVGAIGKEIADSQLASALTGYTRKGKYLYKPNGTKVTPEEMTKLASTTKVKPTLKKGDEYLDESGKVQTFKYGGYLNTKRNK